MSKKAKYDCRQCGKTLPLSVMMDGQKLICSECGQETNLLQALSRSETDPADRRPIKTGLPQKDGKKMRVNGPTAEMTADRMAAMNSANEPVSLITGQESLAELRKKIIEFSQAGRSRQTHLHGPFQIMGSLSYDSLNTLVNSLSREACLDLFKMEQNRACNPAHRVQSKATAAHSGEPAVLSRGLDSSRRPFPSLRSQTISS